MQLQQLYYILEVAKTGSMNKAAQNLFVSQPNLSSSIANLESELNIKIFNRTNKGVVTTQEGTLLLKYARAIIGQVDQLKDVYTQISDEKVSLIDISQNRSLYLSSVITKFYKDFNNSLKITNNICSIFEVIKNVFSSKSEIGIIGVSTIQQNIIDKVLEQKKLEFKSLINSQVCIIVDEQNPISTYKTLSIDDLVDLTYIGYLDENKSFIKYSVELSEVWTDSNVGSINVNDLDSLFDLLVSIDSYSFDLMLNQSYFSNKGIKCIPLVENIEITVGYIKKKNQPLSKEMELFINVLKDVYCYK